MVSISGDNPPTSIGIQRMHFTHIFRWSPYMETIHLLQSAFKRCLLHTISSGGLHTWRKSTYFNWHSKDAFYTQYLPVVSIICGNNPPTSIDIRKVPLTHNTFRWSPYVDTIHPLQSAFKRCLLHTIPSGGLHNMWKQSTHFNRHSKGASYTQYLSVVSICGYNRPTSIGIQKVPLTHNTFRWSP